VASTSELNKFDGANYTDNNANTKWISTFIVNPYTRLDLDAQNSLCGVDIGWTDGASHQYRFNVSVSTDGTIWRKARRKHTVKGIAEKEKVIKSYIVVFLI